MVDYQVVRDEPSQVHAVIHRACTHPGVQAVIFTGGTGITARDQTFEAIDALLEKRLPGFGELFRWLSYQEIGSAAMLSRAQAGVRAGRVIFSLPGSPAACRLAVERLILPELSPHGRAPRTVGAPQGDLGYSGWSPWHGLGGREGRMRASIRILGIVAGLVLAGSVARPAGRGAGRAPLAARARSSRPSRSSCGSTTR